MRLHPTAVVWVALVLAACSKADPPPSAEDWLTRAADGDERFRLVSKHLRGFDVAMLEVGHRYAELYWAGQDANWDYANYQVEKIRIAVANGVERRPKRAASAKMLEPSLDALAAAVRDKDAQAFSGRFDALTATCNACHVAESVSFVTVVPPVHRTTVVRNPADGASR